MLAGAGSGKTSVITRKIAALIREYDYAPRHIVAVTFTNKAAREMKTRVADLLNGDRSRDLTIGTFHALGLSILRGHLKELGYRRGFSIYDAEDSRALVAKLLSTVSSEGRARAEQVHAQISSWKNALVLPDEALSQHPDAPSLPDEGEPGGSKHRGELLLPPTPFVPAGAHEIPVRPFDGADVHWVSGGNRSRERLARDGQAGLRAEQDSGALKSATTPSHPPQGGGGVGVDDLYDLAARVYGEYERHLEVYNAFDFDDLILKPVRLFREYPEILKAWRARVRYLLVDEYQDTNLCQYQLVRLLVETSGALTVVGDDDQSIYGWRGARPENLRQLTDDFPNLRVVKLEQNYRSGARILRAANSLIAHNPHVFEKRLWGELGAGEKLRVIPARSEEHEAERVVSEVQYHKFKHGTDFRDYAILFRENHQARVFERVLRERRIPYHLSGGTSFFERTEVKDIMAYLRLLTNPHDDNAFLRVVNTPRREIGPATLEGLSRHAAVLGISLLEASRDAGLAQALPARQLAVLRQFTEWLQEMVARAERDEPVKLVFDLLAELGYEDWLKETCNDRTIAARRMENVLELIAWLQRLNRQEGQDKGLGELVARMTLIGMLDRDEDNPGDAVSLMTLHAAKGLEFPHVFIVGAEEGLLPHHQSIAAGGIEEERRLLYVGMTRARQTLAFSYAARRRRGGEIIEREPSRFLQELPPEELHWEDPAAEPDPLAMLGRADVYLANLRSMLNQN